MLGDQPAQVVALEGEGGDDVDGGLGRQCFKNFFFFRHQQRGQISQSVCP